MNQSLKKADEWRRLLTVAPIVLWWAWKNEHDDDIPDTEPDVLANEVISTKHSRKRKSLYDVILLLCAGVRLLSTKTITMAQAKAGQTFIANYCQRMLLLGATLTINHHIAMHLASMIKLFGPIYSWWLFAFERFNGMLEKVNTNGHDGGEMELTMLRNWVQTHLIYELLLGLPEDASPHEHNLLDRIIRAEAKGQRGGMMTQIAIFRAEAAADCVSLPKRLPKPVDLFEINLRDPRTDDRPNVYTLLLQHCQRIWPDLNLCRQLSMDDGLPFNASKVARRLPYIRKDGLRYGCFANARTQADSFAFIEQNNTRVPIQIEELLLIEIPETNKPPHVCAVIRRMRTDTDLPPMPWNML